MLVIYLLQVACPMSMEALEARQDAILARLGQLKDQVAAYKKTLGLPEISSPSVSVVCRYY